MTLGPIEIVTLVFPDSNFNGEILPELVALIEAGTVTVVDGVFAVVEDDGAVTLSEFTDAPADTPLAALAGLIHAVNGVISDDDVHRLTEDLSPGSSAAILVFEHTWVKPLRDAIFASGGFMHESVRVPGTVVESVLEQLQAAGITPDAA